MEIITHVDLAPNLLPPFRECQDNYDVGDSNAEWPNNLISRQAVIYENGTIARSGETPVFQVAAAELALVRRLSREFAKAMQDVEVGMGSESSGTYYPFFIAANQDELIPESITEELIRQKFGNTIFPPASITVEPLEASGIWWQEVLAYGGAEEDEELADGGDEDEYAIDFDEYLAPFYNLIQVFRAEPEIHNPVFVRVGDLRDLWNVPKDAYPIGTEITGCVLPRLAIGLTQQGSLVGLFGVSVQT